MRAFDHERRHGHLDAWRELNRRVAEDLKAEPIRGDIKPAKWFQRRANAAKVHIGLFAAKVLRGRFARQK